MVLGEEGLEGEQKLVGEDLVPEHVSSEESSIGVRGVNSLLDGNIWESPEEIVEPVVLVMGGIKVLAGVLIGSVMTHKLLEVVHSESLFMGIAWCFEHDTSVDIRHLVVSHEHQ